MCPARAYPLAPIRKPFAVPGRRRRALVAPAPSLLGRIAVLGRGSTLVLVTATGFLSCGGRTAPSTQGRAAWATGRGRIWSTSQPAHTPARPCGSCTSEPLELLPRPHDLQRVAALLVPVDDRPPRLGSLLEPSLPLEQEGAHVEAADALAVELERSVPVGKCALHVA